MDNGAGSYRRFLDGDEGGLAEIISAYREGLLLYLNGYTQNIHLAEELMEDTFVKLVVKKPRFTETHSFKTWLYTIARNVATDYFRRRRCLQELSEEEWQNIRSDEADLEQSYLRQERAILLHRAMSKLQPDYRQALYLSYFEEFDNAQIADIMGKSKRQIENLIYRGKLSLKAELNKEDFF